MLKLDGVMSGFGQLNKVKFVKILGKKSYFKTLYNFKK